MAQASLKWFSWNWAVTEGSRSIHWALSECAHSLSGPLPCWDTALDHSRRSTRSQHQLLGSSGYQRSEPNKLFYFTGYPAYVWVPVRTDVRVCVYVCVSVCVCACYEACVEVRGQLGRIHSFHQLGPGIKFRSPGLAASAFTHRTVSPS